LGAGAFVVTGARISSTAVEFVCARNAPALATTINAI
jgi:hypothetical protein